MTNKKFYIASAIIAVIVLLILLDFIISVPDEMVVTYIRIMSAVIILLSIFTIILSSLVIFSKKTVRWRRVVSTLYIVGLLIIMAYEFLNLLLTALTWGAA